MSAIDSGESELAQALRDLLLHWEASGDGWRDQSRTLFGATYFDDLTTLGEQSLSAMAGVSELLRRLQQDCRL
jgi:hypothetical protein